MGAAGIPHFARHGDFYRIGPDDPHLTRTKVHPDFMPRLEIGRKGAVANASHGSLTGNGQREDWKAGMLI